MSFSIQCRVVRGIFSGHGLSRREGLLRYKKAPILEAVLEFRWSQTQTLDDLKAVLASSEFDAFEEPKPRVQIEAAVDVDAKEFSHQKRQLGFEVALRDGSEIVFLEEQKFVFVQPAPYDRWEHFSQRALALLASVVSALGVSEFSRVGLRFVNRIDIPNHDGPGINTDEYVTIKFDGLRHDRGIIEEFQMRVVKPTERDGIHYALVLATTASPLPGISAILLDIDVFTRRPVPASGEELFHTLDVMRSEKNDIFEECLTDKARSLFGGVEE